MVNACIFDLLRNHKDEFLCVCVNRGVFSSLSALETEPKKSYVPQGHGERRRKISLCVTSISISCQSDPYIPGSQHSPFLNAWGKILIYRENPDCPDFSIELRCFKSR